MTELFTLERIKIGRSQYGHQIIAPDGREIGPTFNDTGGPAEAAPLQAALRRAWRLGNEAGAIDAEVRLEVAALTVRLAKALDALRFLHLQAATSLPADNAAMLLAVQRLKEEGIHQ